MLRNGVRTPPAMSSPWAAPGTAAPQPVPTAAAPAPAGDGAGDSEPTLPPVPVELGPMTIPDLLDGAFAIVKRRPRDVVVLAATFIIPVEVLSAVLLRDILGSEDLTGGTGDPTAILTNAEGEVVGAGAAITALAVSTISLVLLAGALGVLVDGWYRGRHVSAGEAIAAALRRSPALLIGTTVVHLFEAIGFLALGIGAYLAMALCHVAAPATAVERLGPFAGVARSVRLTRRRLGPALAVPGLVGLVGMGVALGFQALPEVAVTFTPDDWHWLVRAAGTTVSQLVVVPFTAGVAVLFHLDLRVRTEAFDIELRARELLAG